MCSIIGSYSANTINTLAALNASRGTLSSSIARFSNEGKLLSIERNHGPLPLVEDHGGYILCHQQAPTTEENNTVHPSEYNGNLLWHNGIIKSKYLERMIAGSPDASKWDTHQLNIVLTSQGFDGLSPIMGSFSCAWYTCNQLFLFRNAISPMYMNGTDISSVPFSGAEFTEENTVYELQFKDRSFAAVSQFTNVETPFYFG